MAAYTHYPPGSRRIPCRSARPQRTGANRELSAVHEDVIRRHLAHEDSASILERVRTAIVEELPPGRITEEKVARSLNVSRRTLHRRRRGHSATFRGLLGEVRQALARSYIRAARSSVTEVAFSLRYAATSVFSRAFRGRFGTSCTEAGQRSRLAQ